LVQTDLGRCFGMTPERPNGNGGFRSALGFTPR
jgi:hypothetical protein